MKRGISDAIAYVKTLLGLVQKEPVVPLKSLKPAPISAPITFEEDISTTVGHFNFNKWRTLKETGGQINTEFYDENGDLVS